MFTSAVYIEGTGGAMSHAFADIDRRVLYCHKSLLFFVSVPCSKESEFLGQKVGCYPVT